MIEVPVLPIRDLVVFPKMMVPLFLARSEGMEAIEAAGAADDRVFVVAQKDPALEEPRPEDCFAVGTLCSVVRTVRLADGRLKVLVHGETRARLIEPAQGPRPAARVEPLGPIPLAPAERIEAEALLRSIHENLDNVVQLGKNFSPDVALAVENVSPEQLPDALGAQLGLPVADAQRLLETEAAIERLRVLGEVLAKEAGILGVKAEIETQAKEEFSRSQREYFLREQIRMIKNELGESDDRGPDVIEYERKLKKVKLPTLVRTEADKQIQRLEQMHPDSAEASIIKTYLDWIAELPWSRQTTDRTDLAEARRILDADHYDLQKVKQRILEFLGVRKLKGSMKGPILCFVGAPGVGKTSLGKSIAKSLGREFTRISLGGIKDEAEIRGHRRTYVGALPGRILQGIKQAGVRNPVFMLDEIDKVGSDFRGDPSSALLEVLDPEQNKGFSDHYLALPFDLSEVLFIATANVLDPVPSALRDRMEVIEISGYSEEEKLHIARKFLFPRQLEENGITHEHLSLTDGGIEAIVTSYTRESGVRNLEREIAGVCRKIALQVAEGRRRRRVVSARNVAKYLGPTKYEPLRESARDEVGVATGLAWTPYGGELLYVEAQFHRGKRGLVLTGQLGEVMKESAHAALSYVRTRSDLGVTADFFEKNEIHLHVPEGAIPKDGPSAGITLATALLSAITRRPVRKSMALTGEITLRGRVLPVGGIREKLLAARRMGIAQVLVPRQNLKDLAELPRHVRASLGVVAVEQMDEVLAQVLLPRRRKGGAAGREGPVAAPAASSKPARRRWARTPAAKRTPPTS